MNTNEKTTSNTGRWPTGMSFLLYCAGISLVLLVGYVIFSGKGFHFSANGEGVAFRSALNQGGEETNSAKREEKSAEFQEKFEQIKRVANSENADAISEEPVAPTPKRSKKNVAAPIPNEEDGFAPEPEEAVLFNGRWTGNGSYYVLEQHGSVVALMEMTNGIVTSYAQGTADGQQAQLMATNISGLTFPVQIVFEGHRLKLTANGSQFYLDRG